MLDHERPLKTNSCADLQVGGVYHLVPTIPIRKDAASADSGNPSDLMLCEIYMWYSSLPARHTVRTDKGACMASAVIHGACNTFMIDVMHTYVCMRTTQQYYVQIALHLRTSPFYSVPQSSSVHVSNACP